MRKLTYPAICLFLSLGLPSCSGHSEGHDEHDGHGHAEAAHADDHDGLILLNPADLPTLGIEVEEVQPASMTATVKVAGEIIQAPGAGGNVAARQAGLVKIASGIAPGVTVGAGRTIATVTSRGMSGGDPNEAAAVTLEAARREVDRITPLHKEGIVSTRDYNAALQRLAEARAAMGVNNSAGGSAATAPVAGTVSEIAVVDGQYVESGQTIAVISSNSALSLRADIPQEQLSGLGAISGARFRPAGATGYTDLSELGGTLTSSPAGAVASGGYIPVYFSLGSGAGLRAGTYCDVYLLGNERPDVISLPDEAISEQQGRCFVYGEVSPGHYRKIPVQTGASDGLRTEILSGVNSGDRIVCRGTTYVRLAETSGVVPEGHSHSH